MRRTLRTLLLIIAAVGMTASPSHVTASAGGVGGKLIFESWGVSDSVGGVPNFDIWVADEDGTGLERLTDSPGYEGTATWSPDGGRIAFSSDRHGNYDVFVMNADGSGEKRLTSSRTGELWPTWSPNGRRIAYAKGTELWTMKVDGSDKQKVYGSRGQAVRLSDWSPDGRWIGFTLGNISQGWDIEVIHPNGSGLKKLVASKKNEEGVKWSPDGKKIAFNRFVGCERACHFDIIVANADGTGQKNVTKDPLSWEYSPVWSPDGSQLAFSLDDMAGLVDIFTVNADGTGMRRLVTKPESLEYYVDWKPGS